MRTKNWYISLFTFFALYTISLPSYKAIFYDETERTLSLSHALLCSIGIGGTVYAWKKIPVLKESSMEKTILEKKPIPALPYQPKALVWDLGGVLLSTSRFGMIKDELGFSMLLKASLYEKFSITQLQDHLFAILHTVHVKNREHVPTSCIVSGTCARYEGRPLPAIMCSWLAGTASSKDIISRASALINNSTAYGTITKKLLKTGIKLMFDPKTHGKHTSPIAKGLKLLKKCAMEKDEHGNQRYQLFILSNYAEDCLEEVFAKKECRTLCACFPAKNRIISGTIHKIKPYHEMYAYLEKHLANYGIKKEEMILIDDQTENILAAHSYGMPALQLKNSDYGTIERIFRSHGILKRKR